MYEARFIRQSGLVDSTIFDTHINVIGAGAIGSFTALALAKMGFQHISVWDIDNVEEHNLPNQFYPTDAINKPKVEALKQMIFNMTDVNINTHNSLYDKDSESLKGVVISAVDNMASRKIIYNSIKRNSDVIAFIDGRMGANQLEVYTTMIGNDDDKKQYKKTLWKDEDTSQIRCSEKAVMYNVLNIASWICNQVRLVLSNKQYSRQLIMDLENMIMIGGAL